MLLLMLMVMSVTIRPALGACNINPAEPLTLTEHTEQDTLLRNFSTEGEEVIVECNYPDFFTVENGSLYSNISFEPDKDKNVCDIFKKETGEMQVTCDGITHRVPIIFKSTDDFDPRFTEDTYTVKFNELNPVRQMVVDLKNGTYQFTDKDCVSQLSSYGMSFDPDNPVPFITISSTVLATQTLDFEQQREYSFNITVATHMLSGGNARTGTAQLTVMVKDVDDMPPEFDLGNSTEYDLKVEEETNLSTQWLMTSPEVYARDGDVGINDTIEYYVLGTNLPLDLTIDRVNGSIRISDTLDREKIDEFVVTIQAKENSSAGRTATARVRIHVEDVNDNRPTFSPVSRDVRIREDAGSGYRVTWVSALDKDLGSNAESDYVIRNDSLKAFNLTFDNVSKLKWLTVANGTALRGQSAATVEIEAKEKQPMAEGSDQCDLITTCILTLNLTIDDVNDHDPEFLEPLYDLTYQNQDGGIVTTLSATDKDRGANARISYSLIDIGGNVDCGGVNVTADTGEVKVNGFIKEYTTCSFWAQACDNPTDISFRRCSTVQLIIRVLPDDASVVQYNITVQENVPLGTTVKILPLPDLKSNVSEFITSKSMLVTNGPLDRENTASYTVGLSSGNDPAVVIIVQVTVDDVNDNTPQFSQPHYDVILKDDAEINKVILKVNATDQDIGDNAKLTYSWVTESKLFEMRKETGEIILKELPRQDSAVPSLDLLIAVTDSGIPALQNAAAVKVNFLFANDSTPVLVPTSVSTLEKMGRIKVAKHLNDILSKVVVSVVRMESISTVDELGSTIYITGVWADEAARVQKVVNDLQVPRSEMDRMVQDSAQEIHEKFKAIQKENSPDNNANGDEEIFSAHFIAILCVSVLLLLGVIVLLFLLQKARNQNRKRLRVLDNLSKDGNIYNNLSLKEQGDSRTSILDNSGNAETLTPNGTADTTATPNENPRNGEMRDMNAFENPTFLSDEEDIPGTSIERLTHYEDNDSGQGEASDHNGSQGTPSGRSIGDRVTRFGAEPTSGDTPNSNREQMFTSVIQVDGANSVIRNNNNENHVQHSNLNNLVIPRPNSESDSGLQDDREAERVIEQSQGQSSNKVTENSTVNVTPSEDNADEHLDIMTNYIPPPPPPPPLPSSSLTPSSRNDDEVKNENKPNFEEPEPDYAKRVRFGVEKEDNKPEESQVKETTPPVTEKEVSDEKDCVDEEIPNPESFYLAESHMTAF